MKNQNLPASVTLSPCHLVTLSFSGEMICQWKLRPRTLWRSVTFMAAASTCKAWLKQKPSARCIPGPTPRPGCWPEGWRFRSGRARLGRWLHLRAYRDTPTHPEALYYHARYRLERYGPLSAWEFLRIHADGWSEAPPEVRADWFGLHGFVAARLRDFDRAERWLNRAESITHDRAWLCIERAASLEFAERYEESLACARRSLSLVPYFRPGVQAESHLLQVLGREREALDKLLEAAEHIESAIVVAHLAGLQMDLHLYEDARRSYERYVELSPLLQRSPIHERDLLKWVAARRSDTAYFCGDLQTAREQAFAAYAERPVPDDDFYRDFTTRLTKGQPRLVAKKLLTLPATPPKPADPPKTLQLLAKYWNVTPTPIPPDGGPTEGIPDARERRWVEDHAFIAVEFTVQEAIAATLIDRGIPFLLSMVDSGYAHPQIVCGYDELRNSFWIRDAAEPRPNEAPIRTLIQRYAASGPRGLAIVPPNRTDLLYGLHFPDSEKYQKLHRLQLALGRRIAQPPPR